MKKTNALVLALLGSLSIVASVALVAKFYRGSERTVPSYRLDRYASKRITPQMHKEETQLLEAAMTKDTKFKKTVESMREQGMNDKQIIENLEEQGIIKGFAVTSEGKMIILGL